MIAYLYKNFFWIWLIVFLFIPFIRVYQFVSYSIFVLFVLKYYKLFNLKLIVTFLTFQFFVLCIINLFYYDYSYFLNFIFGIISCFPLVFLFIKPEYTVYYKLDFQTGIKIVNTVLLIYTVLLVYQILRDFGYSEALVGIQSKAKGPHLNAQIYLIAGGFNLLKKNFKTGVYFVLIGFFGQFNLAIIIFSVATALSIVMNISKSRWLKIASIIIAIFAFAFYMFFLDNSKGKITGTLQEVQENPERSRKIVYITNFFTNYYKNEPLIVSFFGSSIGNGGSRSAMYFTDYYFLEGKFPQWMNSEPHYQATYVRPLMAHVGDYNVQGTINQPYSNLIGFITEFGIVFFIIFAFYSIRFVLKLRNRIISKLPFDFIMYYLLISIILYHEVEQLPIMTIILYFIILLITEKKKNSYNETNIINN